MARPRAGHTATTLPNGRVLIVGGCVAYGCCGGYDNQTRVTSTAVEVTL